MLNKFNDLISFTELAEKNRKYAPGTADGLRASIRKFEAISNEEEKDSLEVFISRLDQIFRIFVDKYKSEMTLASMNTYKQRIKKVIDEYNKYGKNPEKMSSWTPNTISRSPKNNKQKSNRNEQTLKNTSSAEGISSDDSSQQTKFEIPLNENERAIIYTPAIITTSQIAKIKGYINYLESFAIEDKNIDEQKETSRSGQSE